MPKKLRWFLPTLLALVGLLALAAPVAASTPVPDELEIQEVVVYENYHVGYDQLYIITYYIGYDPLPRDSANKLFLFRLFDDTDSPVAIVRPYAYNDKGYGMGVVAFYLDPDDALDWESNITVYLTGDPLVDWDGSIPSTSTTIVAWNTGTTTEVKNLVAAKILTLAAELEQDWGITLTATSAGTTALNSEGQAYFQAVIPYLTETVPYVIGRYVFGPDYPIDPKPAPDTYANSLMEAVAGTIFDLSGPARSMGITQGQLTAIIYYPFVVFFIVLLIMKAGLRKGAMLLAWPFVVAGAFFGVPLFITILASFMALLGTVWVFYKGSAV
jgi:hypothetical protein